ncbi:MAG: proline--tRNA ligase [Acidimicrobiales bacterium]|nr:proline--tRNA ligase [Acidimicrobiales bacterium]
MAKTAIQPTRDEDFPTWYQAVVQQGELAEMAHVRGCMVIKPWGYGIWELLRDQMDRRIRETGHENAYFPLFVPLSYIRKEAAHVEGFAKEMAVVTHHRLEMRDGELVPAGELEEPVVVRPTSETIIGESMKRWIQSYRDLPLLLNQWANVVRWEMRPRVLLRTVEFLWQEGHTAHASPGEAREETAKMHEVYREFAEHVLAMPVIAGEKPASERFPGAENTYTIEAMMQDGKALQCGTSHFLGQNFSRAADMIFTDENGELVHPWTTSWGVSTRLIGGLVMVHGDDDGLRIPPAVAPTQIVVIPYTRDDERDDALLAYCRSVAAEVESTARFRNGPVRVKVDERLHRPVDKKWQWIKRGVPIIVELGGREADAGTVTFRRRSAANERETVGRAEFAADVGALLEELQSGYLDQARAFMAANTRDDIVDFEGFTAAFAVEGRTPFVLAKWCERASCEEPLKPLAVTIRCLPLAQRGGEAPCVVCGQPATIDAVFARSY